MLGSPFDQVAALLLLGSVAGLAGLALRQPLIVSFIITGVLAGPSGFDLVELSDQIDALARLGVAVLLFLVGLKLDTRLIRSFGRVAVISGLGQVLFTAVIGMLLCIALGLSLVAGAYVAIALTFSSTIIVVKLLSDKREIDSLHGRIALGILIVQDVIVIVAMVALSALGAAGATDDSNALLQVAAGGAALFATVALFMYFVAEPLLARISRSPELLVVFAIGWAAMFATLADHLGLSKELGGLLAGVSLGSTSFRDAIASRLTSLRDFLLLFFFIELGVLFDLRDIGAQLPTAVLLSLFVLIGNPLIVMVIMGAMGYRKRTGFLSGIILAQISEFSLIFVALGEAQGHIGKPTVALTTVVGLVTIALSTYMILYAETLYRWIEPLLGPFERRRAFREDHAPTPAEKIAADTIIFGLGRHGTAIAHELLNRGRTVLGVDFDPEAVAIWRRQGLPTVYGDASDPEFPIALPLASARWVVSAIPHPPGVLSQPDPQVTLVAALRAHGFTGRVAVTATSAAQAESLKRIGADALLMPFIDAAAAGADKLA
jgi:Kef-type K+ transport system membrane component KefB